MRGRPATEAHERAEHLAEAGRYADEVAFYLETFADFTAVQLRRVVETHEVEEAIGAATRLLAEQYRMTVVDGEGELEILPSGRRDTKMRCPPVLPPVAVTRKRSPRRGWKTGA